MHSRRLNLTADALGSGDRIRQSAFGQQDGELLSAEPSQFILAAQLPAGDMRELAQRLVSSGMAVLIVDTLEKVDVDQQQTAFPAMAACAREFDFEALLEMMPVGATGKRVGGCDPV